VRSLTSLSTPHPQALVRALARSTQALHSWYMLLFQVPRLPEWLALRRFEDGLVRSGLPPRFAAAYAGVLTQPGALTAALNWYRALPFGDRSLGPVTVPTTYVWSTGDRFLTRRAAELTADHVTGPYRFEVLEGVSHWIPEVAPERVVELVLDRVTN
jgi:pimeloyl-ACP methyl ester carboxylesterase